MLSQLTRLSVEADGRYAKAEELQFLKGYFQSVDLRISVYEKIRVAESEIIKQVENKTRAVDPNLFINGYGADYTERWRSDSTRLLRYATAAFLFNEQDRLRDGLLLWHYTIAKSYKFEKTCSVTFEMMQQVVKNYLSPEEAALFCPVLQLNHIVLVGS